MKKFNIKLERESFYINEGGSVIGIICFHSEGSFFPGKQWDDFVVVMLYWLAKEVVALSFNTNKTVESPFMEGCFKIALSLNNESQCIIQFIEGEKLAGDDEIIHKEITVPFEDVKDEVKKACELLLKMKETKELDFEEDYEKLKESYEMLCKC